MNRHVGLIREASLARRMVARTQAGRLSRSGRRNRRQVIEKGNRAFLRSHGHIASWHPPYPGSLQEIASLAIIVPTWSFLPQALWGFPAASPRLASGPGIPIVAPPLSVISCRWHLHERMLADHSSKLSTASGYPGLDVLRAKTIRSLGQ